MPDLSNHVRRLTQLHNTMGDPNPVFNRGEIRQILIDATVVAEAMVIRSNLDPTGTREAFEEAAARVAAASIER